MRATICFVTAVPMTADAFLEPYIRASSGSMDIHIVSSARGAADGQWHTVRLERRVSLAADSRSVVELAQVFKLIKPTIVHSISPKAGFVASIAGRLVGVPIRIHTFTGQVWSTRSGLDRWVIKTADRVTARTATHVLVDSWSQRNFLVQEKVLGPGEGTVLAFGSVAGVRSEYFEADERDRRAARKNLGLSEDEVLALYVGRLTREKGLFDLAQAFVRAHAKFPRLRLIAAGPDEEGIAPALKAILRPCGSAVSISPLFVPRPVNLLVGADILCLPSYREGFGSTVIEAAACGVPSITTDVYGLRDSVVAGDTGVVIPAGSPAELAAALVCLGADADMRARMGRIAQSRAKTLYTSDLISAAADVFYESVLHEHGGPQRHR